LKAEIDTNAVRGMLVRLAGTATADHFVLEAIPKEQDKHVFELDQQGSQIVVRGSSPAAMAFGFHWYVKYSCKCHFSWQSGRLNLPDRLPAVEAPVRMVRPYTYFYHLNFVTYSYSMAFWDWPRWERELDWMACNGIDLVLDLTGHEEVWRRTLLRLGYSKEEIQSYICGPAFFPFQWLGVMYGWGGPLPDTWYDSQVELADKIHSRMRELGMTRVLQGYTGNVPPGFKEKFPASDPVTLENWVGMKRPCMITPDDPLFGKVARTFYEEQIRLFGTDHYYAADPFHEGSIPPGLNLADSARLIQQEMLQADPEAVWVLQGWWDNPKPEMMKALDRERTVILDLWGENSPRWKREGEDVFYGLPWIWTFLHNFGGRSGLYGDMQGAATQMLEALHHPGSNKLLGAGLAPEAIEQNPVMYELMTEMGWRKEIDIGAWLSAYIDRRYGKRNENAQKAWELLRRSAYGYSRQPGPTQSIMNQRPTNEGEDKVFKWDSLALYYNKADVEEACRKLYAAFDELKLSDGYLYDLVDVTRQALANKAIEWHADFKDAYKRRDRTRFNQAGETFLQMMESQDRLLNTRSEFQLGPWLEQAKARGRTPEERLLYEFNARALLTIWSDEAQDILHDYANREWAGLTADFYMPRWRRYIDSLRTALETEQPPVSIHWFEWESEWTRRTDLFATEPEGDIRTIVGNIIESYL